MAAVTGAQLPFGRDVMQTATMSLPGVSPATEARVSLANLDLELFISAIGNRPAIWDKKLPEYSNRILKTNMWEEVYDIVIGNWSELTLSEKKTIGAEVQKKWRHLKDNYKKEVAAQKKAVSGQASKKRRPYIHFEALSFLASQPSERNTSGNVTIEDSQDDVDDSNSESIEQDNRKHERKLAKKINQQRDDEIMEILRKERTYDEDISFTEMLVPMLKKLNEDQKHFAKIEILNALNKAKGYTCSPQINSVRTSVRTSSSPAPRGTPPIRQVRSAMSHYNLSDSPSPSPSSIHDNYASSEASYIYSPIQSPQNLPLPNSVNPPFHVDVQYSAQPETMTPQYATSQPSRNQKTMTGRNITSQPNPLNSPPPDDVQYHLPPQYDTSQPSRNQITVAGGNLTSQPNPLNSPPPHDVQYHLPPQYDTSQPSRNQITVAGGNLTSQPNPLNSPPPHDVQYHLPPQYDTSQPSRNQITVAGGNLTSQPNQLNSPPPHDVQYHLPPQYDTSQPSRNQIIVAGGNLTSQPNPLNSPPPVDIQYNLPQILTLTESPQNYEVDENNPLKTFLIIKPK